MPSRPEDTRHFGEGRRPIRHVAQTECDRDDVESGGG